MLIYRPRRTILKADGLGRLLLQIPNDVVFFPLETVMLQDLPDQVLWLVDQIILTYT